MKDSKFQKAIYKKVKNSNDHVMIKAVAGSGKTTTILNCLKIIPRDKTKAFLAFNNSIVDELKTKITDKSVSVTTMHSICWRTLMKKYGYKIKLNPNKSAAHIKKQCRLLKLPENKIGLVMYNVSKLIDLIRQNLVDLQDDEALFDLADRHDLIIEPYMLEITRKVMAIMNKSKTEFDYTDMIFRIVNDKISMQTFDFVFVDESQDLSKMQHQIIKSIVGKKGRLIAVGDPRQAIYGFAGADNDSYKELTTLFKNTIELPLSVNYRCGTDLVRHAQEINPEILPFKKNDKGVLNLESSVKKAKSGDWILCRNVKPLIILNLHFLLKGQKCYIRGKDIGVGLEQYIKKANCVSISSLLKKIDLTVQVECRKLKAKGVRNPMNTEKVDRLNQRNDAIKLLCKNINTVAGLIKFIRTVFKDNGEGICLSTIHKSKGLENDRIFILCPELIPSRFAVQDWQLEQESNLLYVARTRAKKEIHYISDYQDIEKEILKKLKDE